MTSSSELFKFQDAGATQLANADRLYLADEPGLGKTRTILEAARRAGVDSLHVLCPAVVREQWKAEHRAMGHGYRLVVESYQRYVVSEAARREFVFKIAPTGALALDEAHFLKHAESGRTKLILGTSIALPRWFRRVWPVSGTPMPRNPAEAFPVLLSLWPERLKALGVEKYPDFLNRFCEFKWTEYGPRIYGVKDVQALRGMLRGVLLRRMTRDVIPDLPPLRWGVVPLTPYPGLDTVDESRLDKEQVAAIRRGELPPVDENLARYRHAVGDAKAPLAAELLKHELRSDPLAKRVVFAYHRSVLDALQRELELAGYGVVRVDGDTTQSQRDLAKSMFRSIQTVRVFLGQIQACATGLDGLQHSCHDAVLVEPDWSSDVNAQAGKRVSRIGSTLPGLARMLSLAGTLDDAIVRSHFREVAMVQKALNEEEERNVHSL